MQEPIYQYIFVSALIMIAAIAPIVLLIIEKAGL